MHTAHHHIPTSHSKPLAKLLTIAAVVLFAAGGYSSSVLSGLQQLQPVYVAQIPENFPAGTQKACNDRCASGPSGEYKFCYHQCTGVGISRPVGCDANGFNIGAEAATAECSRYASCEGTGFECVVNNAACTAKGKLEPGFPCAGTQVCCKVKADNPATRQIVCNNSCITGPKGEKNFCYRECHPNKEGYKHDVFCKNDGSGGVQWILENEVADTDCGAASGPTATPQPGGPTATPKPGGGPTSTPAPGTGKACTGNGFQCVATGRECEDHLGGTAESGRSGCASDTVCCNLNTKPRCAGDGYTCEAGGNECNAAGGKVINTRVCDRPNLKCCDFQTSCQRSGNQCMDTAACTQLQGTTTGDTSCGNAMICCKPRQTAPASTPMPQCTGSQYECVARPDVCTSNFTTGGKPKGTLDPARDASCKNGNTGSTAVCCKLATGTQQTACAQRYGSQGQCIPKAECVTGNFPDGATDQGQLGCTKSGETCCEITKPQASQSIPTAQPTEIPKVNTCEQAGWTCTSAEYSPYPDGCPAQFRSLTLNGEGKQYICTKTEKPFCCGIIDDTKAKFHTECHEDNDCKKTGNGYCLSGGTCYDCYGKALPEGVNGLRTWGKSAPDQYCVENSDCRKMTSAGTLRKDNTCYHCWGYKKGMSYGYKMATCPPEAAFRNGDTISKQDDLITLRDCAANLIQCSNELIQDARKRIDSLLGIK